MRPSSQDNPPPPKRLRYDSNYSMNNQQTNQQSQSPYLSPYQQPSNPNVTFPPLNTTFNTPNPILPDSTTLNHQIQSNTSYPNPSTSLPNSTSNNSNPTIDRLLTTLPSVDTISIPNSLSNQPLSSSASLPDWDNTLPPSFQPTQHIPTTLPSLIPDSSYSNSDNHHLPQLNTQSPSLRRISDSSQPSVPPLIPISGPPPLPPLPLIFPSGMPSDPNSLPPRPFSRSSSALVDSSNARVSQPISSHMPSNNTNNNNLTRNHGISNQSRSITRPRQLNSIKSPRNRSNSSLHQRVNSNPTSSPSNPSPFNRKHRNSQSSTRDNGLSLAQIGPIKNELTSLADDHPILKALAQFVLQRSNINFSISLRKDKILSFKGFPRRSDPKTTFLSNLGKGDLDMVAWIFNVPTYGRKDDIAKRISTSLFAPLTYRTTSTTVQPRVNRGPTTMRQSSNMMNDQSYDPNPPANITTHRGNMPNIMTDTSMMGSGRTSLVRNLQRQITMPNGSKTITTASTRAPRSHHSSRVTNQMNRAKQQIDVQIQELRGYEFKDPENPFNIPANSPLGMPSFAAFSAMELTRGDNPVLRFFTPAPIDPNRRPDIRGGDVQIHLRCLLMDDKKPKTQWKQAWPFPATCRVNSQLVQLNQAQRYTNGKLAGRDAATDITPFLRKYRLKGRPEENRVSVRRQESNASPASGNFVLLAQEVIVLSHETMTNKVFKESEKYWENHRESLIQKGSISSSTSLFEMARLGVTQFLSSQEEIAVESMKVSLRCPLALTRIKKPVKGKRCQHVQCFDLDNFLQFARRSSKFECPVCNKLTAFPDMLVTSPYVENALEQFPNCDEVEIFSDGSMKAVEKRQTGVASDGEDEDIDTKPLGITGSASRATGPTEVVDLTLDSDDEGAAVGPPMLNPGFPRRRGGAMSGDSFFPDVIIGNKAIPYSRIQGIEREGEAAINQDEEFPFRADFTWRDHVNSSGNEDLRQSRGTSNANRAGNNNWPCDVIAIDSD